MKNLDRMEAPSQDRRRRAAEAKLREMLEAGEASGLSDKTVGEIWAAAEARYLVALGVDRPCGHETDI